MGRFVHSRVRVYVLDDDPDSRRLTAALLAQTTDVTVVGEGEPGPAVVGQLRQLAPDVLVADPGPHEPEALDELAALLRRDLPDCCRLVLYSTLPEDVLAARSAGAGALAHLRKGTSPELLTEAVLAAARRGASPETA